MNLQDMFLNQARREKIPVTISLMSGGKISGLIEGFDQFSIFLKHAGVELVYKHAISSILPSKEIRVFREEEEGGEVMARQREGGHADKNQKGKG